MSGTKQRNNKRVRSFPGGNKVLDCLEKWSKINFRKQNEIPDVPNTEAMNLAQQAYQDFAETANDMREAAAHQMWKERQQKEKDK